MGRPTNCRMDGYDFPLANYSNILWKRDSCDAIVPSIPIRSASRPESEQDQSEWVSWAERQSPLNPFTGIWRWTAVWHDSHSCMWHNPLSKSLPRSLAGWLLTARSLKLRSIVRSASQTKSMNVGAELKLKSNSRISHPNMRIYCSSLTATLQHNNTAVESWVGDRPPQLLNRICFWWSDCLSYIAKQFYGQ